MMNYSNILIRRGAKIGKVKIHLRGIDVSEFAYFQNDDDQAAQPAMEEQQLDAIPLLAHAQGVLDDPLITARLESGSSAAAGPLDSGFATVRQSAFV